MSAKTDPGWESVKPDPLGDEFVLVVRSASKPGKWHRVRWRKESARDPDGRVNHRLPLALVVECDSGICERDQFRPSEECRHEREAIRYLKGETLEAQLAKSIEQAKERTA